MGTSTSHAVQTLVVPEVFNTTVPSVQGDLVFTYAYAGFNVWNRGNYTVRYFSVALTVIGP
ncbi:hypothetical protein V1634_13875 [Plantactinospora veratri]|uniref:Uncharacterized protein n=1 Tax=Plantactinospora veratri TaxID=1436122 RepID=A0ABU7SD95_9ACTN